MQDAPPGSAHPRPRCTVLQPWASSAPSEGLGLLICKVGGCPYLPLGALVRTKQMRPQHDTWPVLRATSPAGVGAGGGGRQEGLLSSEWCCALRAGSPFPGRTDGSLCPRCGREARAARGAPRRGLRRPGPRHVFGKRGGRQRWAWMCPASQGLALPLPAWKHHPFLSADNSQPGHGVASVSSPSLSAKVLSARPLPPGRGLGCRPGTVETKPWAGPSRGGGCGARWLTTPRRVTRVPSWPGRFPKTG